MSDGSYEGHDGTVSLSFGFPSIVDGLQHIHISIVSTDLFRVQTATSKRLDCVTMVQIHLKRVLTVDPDVLILEQFALENLVVTGDGRVKVRTWKE